MNKEYIWYIPAFDIFHVTSDYVYYQPLDINNNVNYLVKGFIQLQDSVYIGEL